MHQFLKQNSLSFVLIINIYDRADIMFCYKTVYFVIPFFLGSLACNVYFICGHLTSKEKLNNQKGKREVKLNCKAWVPGLISDSNLINF